MRSMRTQAIVAVLFFLAGSVGQSRADITYNLVDYPQDQNGSTLSGFITTDGVVGTLASSDILNWSWTITPASGPPSTYSSSDPNATTSVFGMIVASSSEITVAANSTLALYDIASGSTNYDLQYFRLGTNEYAGLGPNNGSWLTINPTMGGTDPWVIATASVPEPSTLTLLGLGAVGLAVAARLKARAS